MAAVGARRRMGGRRVAHNRNRRFHVGFEQLWWARLMAPTPGPAGPTVATIVCLMTIAFSFVMAGPCKCSGS